MQLRQFYSVPETFEPIEFGPGLNLVLGEKGDTSSKNNGVGKSLCIEFLNFALLKGKSTSRVTRIPEAHLNPETLICVEFELAGESYTLRRSPALADMPELVGPRGATRFERIEHATSHLTSLLFKGVDGAPSFREMLGPLIRDEGSEFRTLAGCYDTALRIADNYKPHLYMFGIDTRLYDDLKLNSQTTSAKTKEQNGIAENVAMLTKGGSMAQARALMNGLEEDARAIGADIDKLENTAGYELVKNDIMGLELRIEELRRRRAVATAAIRRMRPISTPLPLDEGEVRFFYDTLKAGLGDKVSRDLSEVMGFKAEIERFQGKVLSKKIETLEVERRQATLELQALEREYTKLLRVLDQDGGLKNLRQTYAAYRLKSEEAAQLRAFIGQHDKLKAEVQKLKSVRAGLLVDMQASVAENSETISSFEDTILDMHQFIQGNRIASFDIEVTTKKQVVELNMRIHDDGSHSIDREKVFIYDYALLTNPDTARRHPGFLVHDNVFEVDQDTLRRSLLFMLADPALPGRQYILTLNSDRLESDEELLDLVEPHVRARFTKADRFLKVQYQEVR